MSDLLAKHAKGKELKGNILTIANDAQIAKADDPSIINATIGMLFNEEGKLLKYKVVEDILGNLSDEELYYYAPTSGGEEFKNAVLKWVLQSQYDSITKDMYYDVMATCGGSGAISNTLYNYLDEGDTVIIPHVYWGPYANFVREFRLNIDNYSFFKDDSFNIDNFKKKIFEYAKKQKRIVTIINDPCHNPTGYTLSHDEWKQIVDVLNEVSLSGVPVILLYDIAYIDYYSQGLEASRKNLELFKKFNENVLVMISFSGSKTLSMYGFRLGAQIALSKNKLAIEEFTKTSEYSSRGRWSNTPRPGLSVITKIVNNSEYNKMFLNELNTAREMLMKRSKLFIKEASEIGLVHFPYRDGFFITIPSEDPDFYERLKSIKIYGIPLKIGVRIALCSISEEECRGLAKKIKSVL